MRRFSDFILQSDDLREPLSPLDESNVRNKKSKLSVPEIRSEKFETIDSATKPKKNEIYNKILEVIKKEEKRKKEIPKRTKEELIRSKKEIEEAMAMLMSFEKEKEREITSRKK